MRKLWLEIWRVRGLVLSIFRKSRGLVMARHGAGQYRHASIAARRSTALGALEPARQLLLICFTLPGCHGGPRHSGTSKRAGAGSRPRPASTAVTRNWPCPQHGHRPTSIFATRAMKAWADSMACGFVGGICKAARAAASLTPLQLLASTP